MDKIARTKEYVRSMLFGIEDSLVSTTGLIAGVSAGSGNRATILLAAIVAVSIEALSMAAGEFLSDETAHEMDKVKRAKDSSYVSAGLMFVAYLTAGFIPILPVMLFPYPISILVSICSALVGLFVLGYAKGRVVKVDPTKSGLKILVIGGVTTLIGVAVGHFLRGVG